MRDTGSAGRDDELAAIPAGYRRMHRQHIHHEDARAHLMASPRRYLSTGLYISRRCMHVQEKERVLACASLRLSACRRERGSEGDNEYRE